MNQLLQEDHIRPSSRSIQAQVERVISGPGPAFSLVTSQSYEVINVKDSHESGSVY
jgi:hypothetical protein